MFLTEIIRAGVFLAEIIRAGCSELEQLSELGVSSWARVSGVNYPSGGFKLNARTGLGVSSCLVTQHRLFGTVVDTSDSTHPPRLLIFLQAPESS